MAEKLLRGLSLCTLFLSPLSAAEPTAVDFNRDIQPILADRCWNCHGRDKPTAGLKLSNREGAVAPLENGHRAIVPGKPDESELIRRIEAADPDVVMPPPETQKPLTDRQKKLLRAWIAAGAEYAPHWAFVTTKRPELPAVSHPKWCRNEIDQFILQRVDQEGLSPSPEAPKEIWLRRVTLDLTGLPPSLEELDAFLADNTAEAYESVVDRLLKSPRHAERMAMHWLDAARYADTNGYNNDETRTMWPWRDWVIEAFAEGMPYDQFLTEQLAGDLLPDATLAQKVATGFNRNHVLTTEGGIFEEEYHVEYVADRVHTTATVFLGLSLQCARCHDHKYDPFSQKEYYQFAAFFNNVPDRIVGYNKGRMAEPLLKVPSKAQVQAIANLQARKVELEKAFASHRDAIDPEIAKWEKSLTPDAIAADELLLQLRDLLATPADQRTDAGREDLRQYYLNHVDAEAMRLRIDLATNANRIAEIDKDIPVTMVMQELEPKRKMFVLNRGQYDQPTDEVVEDVPAVLSPLPADAPKNRLGLARWLTSPTHPLTARIAVNRWWELLFGTGLVETAEDFGIQGSLPSHPELLDWLATELIARQWDQRAILKQIVLSASYRQSSHVTPMLLDRDPRNRLITRGPRYRLPAETVRDNALFVSGLLKEHAGGPSVKPYQPEGLWEDVSVERRDKYVVDAGDSVYRRSMYTFWKRTCPPPTMSAFDAPDRETCVIRRARTNTPLQALVLMNDPTYVEAARKLAERIQPLGDSADQKLAAAFRIVLSRGPSLQETKIMLGLYESALRRFQNDAEAATKLLSVGQAPRDERLEVAELAAWTAVCTTLLNLDEAISKP